MAKHFDVIVIGIGAMGSAACYHLARRGLRVLGLDQYDIPNTLGSSHGLSRMIRSAYYEHPDYVPLLKRSFTLWRELESESREKILHTTGGLYIDKPTAPFITGSLQSARQHNLPHELLTHDEFTKHYPQFKVPQDCVALFEHEAGLLVPEKCIEAHIAQARHHGADIRPNQRVLNWTDDANVTTGSETFHSNHLIFTAGPWTSALLQDLNVNLTVTRQALAWVDPPRPDLFQLGRFPVWAYGHDDGSIHYGFPLLPDSEGLKSAHHIPGEPTTPDTVNRTPTEADEQTVRPFLAHHLPEANGPLRSIRICLYTNSPDHHFILDRHPNHDRVTVAAGFSGHGFKFASVVGEILADLATKGRTDLPAGFLSLRRFVTVR